MPRIIFKCPYIKPGTEKAAAHLNNYVRYVATRDGTDLLKPDKAGQPATKKQRAMVERLERLSYEVQHKKKGRTTRETSCKM
ncbi:hypothetical protein D1646_10990 [Pseudoflavonifractor sp. 60]|uniref:hypothetical protein n=1 Tax=Pseudoflavonifractor sp. 60 TaxID=2304576 RepID=UPI00136F971B|nr:hypothetical protein [Pseudoflavonifractor sp. 60]NBI67327.1 hypothetical protein [Pseudoflavonifractor sp. 60]